MSTFDEQRDIEAEGQRAAIYHSQRSDPAFKRELATEELVTPQPKRIVLCGSSRFCDVMAVCGWLLERDEGKIAMGLHLLPDWYPNVPADHLAEHEGVAFAMDTLHLRKIDLAHEIFVVDVAGYIGSSCSNEIAYAKGRNLPIRYFTSDPIGRVVEAMLRKGAQL